MGDAVQSHKCNFPVYAATATGAEPARRRAKNVYGQSQFEHGDYALRNECFGTKHTLDQSDEWVEWKWEFGGHGKRL